MPRPSSSEYIPVAKRYIDLVPDGNFLSLLNDNRSQVANFFSNIPEEKHQFRYQPGKWTPKQILLHIIDAERVFTYRALTIARGDVDATFPNMDEELFAAHIDLSNRPFYNIVSEFKTVRAASVFLFQFLTEERLRTAGTLFDYPVTPLGFGYIIIGHTLHHINILQERYL